MRLDPWQGLLWPHYATLSIWICPKKPSLLEANFASQGKEKEKLASKGELNSLASNGKIDTVRRKRVSNQILSFGRAPKIAPNPIPAKALLLGYF
jgi:hypothetical protein